MITVGGEMRLGLCGMMMCGLFILFSATIVVKEIGEIKEIIGRKKPVRIVNWKKITLEC